MPAEPDLRQYLRNHWGFDTFRPLQEKVVGSLLQGRDTCVFMPTGDGKSLCCQLPELVLGRTAVVISPLIALMQDQVVQLERMGLPAAVLNRSQTSAQQSHVVRQACEGAYRLLSGCYRHAFVCAMKSCAIV